MSGQESRGSAGEYQADDPAGVARLSWRVSLVQEFLEAHCTNSRIGNMVVILLECL